MTTLGPVRRIPDEQLIGSLRDQLRAAVGGALGGAAECDLVDYPDSHNVGDAALWLASRAVLRDLGVRVAATATTKRYRPFELVADGPVLIIPGGNFGGLWPTHHALKLNVFHDFVGRPVIQLPQSIEYVSDTHRDELRRAVSKHGQTVLFVRDQRSYDLAVRDFDCPVHLVPDMAFGLGALKAAPPTAQLSIQRRVDLEAAADTGVGLPVPAFDWLDAGRFEPVSLAQSGRRASARVAGLLDSRPARRSVVLGADWCARLRLDRGLRMLSAGERLATDRLHGHVLACLMGIPHTVVGDAYGKVEAMWDTWTHPFSYASFMPTWEAAADSLRLSAAPPLVPPQYRQDQP